MTSLTEMTLPTVPPELAARGIVLRPRRNDDDNFLREVYVACRWDETAATGWPDQMRRVFLEDQCRIQRLQYDQNYRGAAWGVVEVDGERAGRLYLHYHDRDLRIVDISFLPAFRGRGIGGRLLAAVQDRARCLGAAKASMHVVQGNPAIRLYERLGFRWVELRGMYCLLEWTVVRAAAMSIETGDGRGGRDAFQERNESTGAD